MDSNNCFGWTTLEQAKKLVAAGLSITSSDMFYDTLNSNNLYPSTQSQELTIKHWDEFIKDSIIYPCWSLGRLIPLLPENIYCDKNTYYDLNLGRFGLMYKKYVLDVYDFSNSPSFVNGIHLIGNVVDAIIWCLKNKYIK